MIFLDTNIWMDLVALDRPTKEHEKEQIAKASSFLKNNTDKIITCKEQQVELFNAIQKAKKQEFNNKLKKNLQKGIGSVKEYRKFKEFQDAVKVCQNAYNDMLEIAEVDKNFSYNVEDILLNLDKADINDNIYFQYCLKNNIKFYTFDKELVELNTEKDIVNLL